MVLQQKFDKTLPAQGKCSERAEFWRECTNDFLSEIDVGFHDILYVLLQSSGKITLKDSPTLQSHDICPSCKTSCPRGDWDELLRHVDSDEFPRPEERKLALTSLACQVFLDVAKFSIWHITFTASSTKQLLWDLRQSALDSMKPRTLCLILSHPWRQSVAAFLPRGDPKTTGLASSFGTSRRCSTIGRCTVYLGNSAHRPCFDLSICL